MDDYSMIANLVSMLIRLAIWGVVGYVMGKKAKDVGLSFGTYFALTFLLGVIGLVITLVKINNQKRNMAIGNMYQQNVYNNQYGQNPYQANQNPYQAGQNPYQSGQNPYPNANMNYQNNANPYMNGAQNPYQNQNVNPYQQQAQPQQGYQQAPYNNAYNNAQSAPQSYDDPNAGNSTFGISFTCKECGNVQNAGGFCRVCGAKL